VAAAVGQQDDARDADHQERDRAGHDPDPEPKRAHALCARPTPKLLAAGGERLRKFGRNPGRAVGLVLAQLNLLSDPSLHFVVRVF
jgi:hypothetical protein